MGGRGVSFDARVRVRLDFLCQSRRRAHLSIDALRFDGTARSRKELGRSGTLDPRLSGEIESGIMSLSSPRLGRHVERNGIR